LKEAKRIGFPVILKASAGGGGRGMRVINKEDELEKSFNEAKREAGNAFGDAQIPLPEKDKPKFFLYIRLVFYLLLTHRSFI